MRSLVIQFYKKLIIASTTLVLVAGFQTANAQVTVRGGFLADSIVVGDQIPYYLTARYPKKLQVLFPDSTFVFQPFEFSKKKYFATSTRDTISYDSAVYMLHAFEIDAVQYLQLPVFVLHEKDCTTFTSNMDSVKLKELVTIPLPDTLQTQNLPLLTDTSYTSLSWLFNYPLALYITGGLLLITIIVWIVFGKRIRKYFIKKRLVKEHQSFLQSFNHSINLLKQNFSSQQTEQLVLHWKKYMENLDNKPYTKLTAKEISFTLKNKDLGDQLRSVDAAIYGNARTIDDALVYLRQHASQTFEQKLEQVTHG